MKPGSFMLIAGEASGDMLAGELVRALRDEFMDGKAVPTLDYQPLHSSLEPRFFGAGGQCMAAAGVDLAVDMTAHSVIGLSDVFKNLLQFRRLFRRLYKLALQRQPDAIICVDFSGFNRRLAHALRQYARKHADWFHDWNPKVIQYVSPQVWASREGRAYKMARDYDLLLSTFAFEKEWYARRVPQFQVEFVGHPLVDRYSSEECGGRSAERQSKPSVPTVLLLPGSRPSEVRRHLPVLVGAAKRILAARKAVFRMVLPDKSLAKYAKGVEKRVPQLEIQIGQVGESLRSADLAITKSGTITLGVRVFWRPRCRFLQDHLGQLPGREADGEGEAPRDAQSLGK